MDTKGNLYNFYNDLDGERKITPVGNVAELQQFKVRDGGEGPGQVQLRVGRAVVIGEGDRACPAAAVHSR